MTPLDRATDTTETYASAVFQDNMLAYRRAYMPACWLSDNRKESTFMQTLAVMSQKGGTGKTTLALNLAVASQIAGKPAVVIDLDPQASAKGWHDHRNADPVVVSAQASRLHEVLKTSHEHGAGLVVIDTAPHSESTALAAARVADLVLIPCRAGILDLRAIVASADICALAKASAAAILNAVPPRGTLADEAEQAIRGHGLTVSPARIGQRMAFVHSLTGGQTALEYEKEGKAAQEVTTLYMWACQHAGMQLEDSVRKLA